MPPKKKVPARRASGKRVRIGDGSIIPSTRSTPTSPSGRRKREATIGINNKLTRTRSPNGSNQKLAKRIQGAQDEVAASPKRRGRPPTKITAAKPTMTATTTKSGRGRPKKAVDEPTSISNSVSTTTKSPKRKREVEEETEAEPPKKRGRPAKFDATRKPLAKKVEKEDVKAKVETAGRKPTKKAVQLAAPTTAKRGRPPGAKNIKSKVVPAESSTTKSTKASAKAKKVGKSNTEDEGEFVEGLTQTDDQGAAETQYWLMKAEPDTRIEKGIDVAYPIDKLAAATEPEPWDGVRNAVARNNMRAMRKGDLAFFYHSNCTVPGVVGVMRIAEEHSIDESAFDPTHPYYDEKSNRDKPKWDCVKVEFVKKFQDIISLRELKDTPELERMQLTQKAYGRLSVQTVTSEQWQFILKMANEPEDLGVTSTVSGYEADTNGETDKEATEEDAIAAYGSPDDGTDEDGDDHQAKAQLAIDEVLAEKERVEAIDAFAKEITSSGDV